jgi:kynurenine 3-monooxygenase
LDIAVVGAGPSGLLLSHLLLQQENTKVTLLDGRSDPRRKETEQRAYALGLGIRGRAAIRHVDEDLWQAVKQRGFESERFQLHIGSLVIPLRSEKDGGGGLEPSLLTFQSELCAALTDELESRHRSSGRLQLYFDTKVDDCDLDAMKLNTDNGGKNMNMGRFDLIVGCDGVNSAVRSAMGRAFPAFETTQERLPGEFKVVRLSSVPPKVDPTAVSLIIPGGAFVEPTGNGGCCILFNGKEDSPLLSETKNATAVVEALQGAFPQWEGFHETIAEQLMAQKVTGSASSVVCNTYHYSDKVALAGDAAHATGGVSGQGVNSALQDSFVLAECIQQNRNNLGEALLMYSQRQVPEGKALYDLSFGPKPKGLMGIRWALRNARDTLFRGKFGIGESPLQTRLTTVLTPFAEIRRERDAFYDAPFPEESEFREILTSLHRGAPTASTETAQNAL